MRFNVMLDNREYDGLEYFTYCIGEKYPIACSSSISPYYSYKGVPMNNHINPNVPFSNITLTILPDNNDTIIIFACFPDDEKGKLFLDELASLSNHHFKQAISSILIYCAENTFFAPALWNALKEEGQRQLCHELEISGSRNFMPRVFPQSNINFFHPKFSAERLGLT